MNVSIGCSRWRSDSLKCSRESATRAGAGAICVAIFLTLVGTVLPAQAQWIDSGESAYARQDYTRSAAIFTRRAERGQAEAQTYLGYMYANGRGVPQDYVMASQWLRRAALQGNPTAQFLLGLLYDKGFGVKEDFVQAEVWLNLATARASASHRYYWTRVRNAVASKLTRAEVADAQKRALEWTPVYER
jgi:uncharacterized protein